MENKDNFMENTSYKDPAGFVFLYNNEIYRQINVEGKADYDYLLESKLYDELTKNELLITHREISLEKEVSKNFYKFIKPQKIDFISYPYEWSFSALKDAALLTLKIQKISLKYKMSLKDASSYNVQFLNGKPIFIDTLSFEKHIKNEPWKAYNQFCRHFLAPLVLMSYVDISLNQLLVTNIDGIPLDIVSNMLPIKAKLNFGILLHICGHSRSQKKYSNEKQSDCKKATMSIDSQLALIESLEDTIKSLKFPNIYTEWGNYYNNTNYSTKAFDEKKHVVNNFIDKIAPKTICDLGANRGDFSRIASSKNIQTLSFDIDPIAVEDNYLYAKKNNEKFILPLRQDFNNLSPSIGFMSNERTGFLDRFKVDMVMALALIHHLAISNNLPFKNIASFFAKLGNHLIVEFIPKQDSKVQILLSSREDIFSNYNQENFETSFKEFFDIIDTIQLKDSARILYLMRKKNE